MTNKFIESLQHLAQSSDITGEATLTKLQPAVTDFFKHNLNPHFYECNAETQSLGGRGLKPHWTNHPTHDFATVRDMHGKYTGLVMYCFDKNKPLWVTASNGNDLADGSLDYIDHWSDIHKDEKRPPYWKFESEVSRTCICLPLRPEWRSASAPPVGFMCVEFNAVLHKTNRLMRPLQQLAEVIANVFLAARVAEAKNRNLERRISALSDLAKSPPFLKRQKPTIFFAYSMRGDHGVIGLIREVFGSRSEFDLDIWEENAEPGDINSQVLSSIAEAQFGICYLSERFEHCTTFTDSLNVVYEAGMLQALTKEPSAETAGWIAVREHNSPRAPFDYAAERVVQVKRDTNTGQLNRHDLLRQLGDLLEIWLENLK